MPWLIALLVLAFMFLWAIFPPVAVAIILIIGGTYLLVLGLCGAAKNADRLAGRDEVPHTISREEWLAHKERLGYVWNEDDRKEYERP